MANQPFVKEQVVNNIGEITFYSPLSNSLNSEQLHLLATKIIELGKNPNVHIVHIKSLGEKTFCAGASFDELLQIQDAEEGKQFFMGFANVINAIRKCEKLVVTSVQGKAVGGGVGIIAASDYVLATNSASIKLSEIGIGIGPFVIEPAITRKIGVAHLGNLALNPSSWKKADWCLQVGLYAEVVADVQSLEIRANAYLTELANYHVQAIKKFKAILWDDTNDWEELLMYRAVKSGRLVLSDFTKDTLQKFRKK